MKTSYFVEKTIGKGHNGEVRMAHHVSTLQKYAVKTFRPNVTCDVIKMIAEAKNEWKILKLLEGHRNIIRSFEIRHCYKESHIILEMMQNDVLAHLGFLDPNKMDEDEAKNFSRQVLSGLVFMHDKGIGHIDMKLENVLMSEGGGVKTYKIADFGFSVEAETTKTGAHTRHYAPP